MIMHYWFLSTKILIFFKGISLIFVKTKEKPRVVDIVDIEKLTVWAGISIDKKQENVILRV
jgi:hypothetical protein